MKKLKRILLLFGISVVLASCSSTSKKNCGSDGVCNIGDNKKLVVNVPPSLID